MLFCTSNSLIDLMNKNLQLDIKITTLSDTNVYNQNYYADKYFTFGAFETTLEFKEGLDYDFVPTVKILNRVTLK